MKKTNLIKGISILLISVMVILFNSSVFAADNTGFTDLTSTLSNGNTNSNTNGNTNSNTNSNPNNAKANTNTNTNSNTNNSSIYNNTNLPKTGVESSIPVAMFVVIFGISAVYAYKKINDYKNI